MGDEHPLSHNLWQLGNEVDYAKCNFDGSGSTELVSQKSSSFPSSYSSAPSTCAHTFSCDTPGTHFFSCSVAGACNNGLQRVRVWVTDSSKTQTLQSQEPQLTTLADAMSDHLVPAAYGPDTLTDAKAVSISAMMNEIVSHSPYSCADWLTPAVLTDQNCKAFAYTDLGFVARVKATPNYTQAQMYYTSALNAKNSFCPAESYLTELRIAQGDKTAADTQFEIACATCGTNSLDMTDVRLAYYRKGWTPPESSSCASEVPKRFSASQLQDLENALYGNGQTVVPSPSLESEDLGVGGVRNMCFEFAVISLATVGVFLNLD